MSPVSTRICVPNLVAVRRSCLKKGGGYRQTDRQTDRQTKKTAALYSRYISTTNLDVSVCVQNLTRANHTMPSFTFIDNSTAGIDRGNVYFDLNYDVNVPQKSQPLQSICDIFYYSNLITKPTCFY